MHAGVERFAWYHTTEKCLAVAAPDAQRRIVLQRLIDLFKQRMAGVPVRCVHQKRSSSGKGNWPAWMCIAPNSAQRCRVGMFLPGLSMPLASNAALMA
ncbi:hypothetical protein ALP29_201658 [Pseudomonas syringae pv. avii]|uniref:Uncharacterized protein n=1 Tax=Pseudomonas syringae pv. avii TaxID=663959 RepID=A0A3M5U8G6_PSESX|nr:hypothetical protein ALP29_201658 [Pseudomonas syringae pv. avii]